VKFHRIYVEVTNICGLKCTFCPTQSLPSTTMDLDFFQQVISECSRYTKEIACHIMGDPMVLSNLKEYLDILDRYKLKALITTSGFYIQNHKLEDIFHPALKQINISLNSYNKNNSPLSLDEYIEPILKMCRYKLDNGIDSFINLRLWNIDKELSEDEYNSRVFELLESFFDIKLDRKSIYNQNSIRIEDKIKLHFDNYFEWPSLANPIYGDGRCLGLNSHIGILSNGVVVPCCLDDKGIIELGNIKNTPLKEILHSKRATDMRVGFQNSKAVEELCQRCSYKERFDTR